MNNNYYVLSCVLVLIAVSFVTSYDRHHGHSSRHSKWPRRHHDREHRIEREKMVMPTGKTYWISTPKLSKYKEKHFKCGAHGNDSVLINLKPDGKMGKKEYGIIKSEIDATAAGTTVNIVSIQKIINPCLWKRYQFQKKSIARETRDYHETFLFHGSSQAMTIMNTGFDERYSNIHGLFGAGLYFASFFAKSNGYTGQQSDGNKLMLVCRVTLGRVYNAKSTHTYSHAPAGYHSVKGQPITYPEFIVYRGEQVYPEYLIKYN